MGTVTPDTSVSSPSGKGVCNLEPNSFTVISGYSYEVPVDINAGEEIFYEIFNPLKNGDGCQYTVQYNTGNEIIDIDKGSIMADDVVRAFSKKTDSNLSGGKLIFKVSSNTPDDSCDWVSFVNPQVVIKK